MKRIKWPILTWMGFSSFGLSLLFVSTSNAMLNSTISPFAIFGEDNRQEIYDTNGFWQEISRSIAGKVSKEYISGSGDYYQLMGSRLGKKVCPGTRFENQITVASCTGFLVKPNILVTAGHCIKTQEDCDNFSWVFDYSLKDNSDANYTTVQSSQIYQCVKIHNRRYEKFGDIDYAIIELDRPVQNRTPLRLGFNFPISIGEQVSSIGHPVGLPLKFVDGADIVRLTDGDLAIDTELDIFQGNSGSPVFDAATGTVLAITSHGHEDFRKNPEKLCREVRICMPGDNCYLSTSSRVTNMKQEPILSDLVQ